MKWVISILYNLSGLTAVAVYQANALRATRLAAAAEILRSSQGMMWEGDEGSIYERAIATARVALSEAEFDTAWEAGLRMTLHEAIEMALN